MAFDVRRRLPGNLELQVMQARDAGMSLKGVAYNVPGSTALADLSQSQTIDDFLHSCHSFRHGTTPHTMPPLPPDIGSSMEKLLLDEICALCQERAALMAKQQSSEQLIKHLEERVGYLEDCLDQSADAGIEAGVETSLPPLNHDTQPS
eukprot:jgi/Ulvmu1/12061/UM083_0074.1